MAELTLTPTWEADIYQIATTDPVIGGPDGISNLQAKQLGNRTEYLKEQTDDHETRVTDLETANTSVTALVTRTQGSATLVKQGVVTSALTNNVFDFLTVAKLSPSPIQNRVTVTASSTNPLVLSFSAGYDADGPLTYYGYIDANVLVDSGSNSAGILYAELDPLTSAVTFGLDTTATSVVVSHSTPGGTGYWYSLKDEVLFRWNGSAWVAVVRVLIASISWSGSGSYSYLLPIGKSIKDVYGRSAIPAGTVSAFAGATAPAGYLLCDGGAISRAIYSDLYATIGTTYGTGDGSTTFNIPDLRGEFIRGLDGGRGIDTDTVVKLGSTTNGSNSVTAITTTGLSVGMAVSGTGIPAGTTISAIASRTSITLSANATATSSTSGVSLTFSKTRTLGSAQGGTLESHEHYLASQANVVNGGSPTTATLIDWDGATQAQRYALNTEYTGGSETRPRNVAMNYIIKF